jgi:hydroxyacylglutathione hydrolase
MLGIHSQPVLVATTDSQVEEARTRLSRVGIEEVRGYLAGGFAAWKQAGKPVLVTPQMPVGELAERLRQGNVSVLDVRRDGEWQAGRIAEANHRALDTFPHGLPALGNGQVAIHCKSGYRSMIACSLLERAGHRNVVNVTGGFDAWQAANLPVATEQLVKA